MDLLSDTTPEIEALLTRIYRRIPSHRKLELVEDANRTARQLAFSGLRARHPGETVTKLRRRLAGLVLGETLAAAAYGPLETGE